MPAYSYKAKDPKGNIVASIMEAENEQVVRGRLRERNYVVTSIQLQQKKFGAKDFLAIFQKVKPKNLAIFARQFSTMINAGLTLVRALDILERQTADRKLKEVIGDVRNKVEGGAALSEAFGEHPRVFSDLFVNLTNAGETGGVLDETLDRVAQFLEKDQELRAKVKGAMTYPIIIIIFAIGIVFVLMLFVIPTFADMFEQMNVKMPALTLFVMNASDSLKSFWWLYFLGAMGFVFLNRFILSTPRGRYFYDSGMLKIPVLGKNLVQKLVITRFTRTLGTLLSSGVPVMQALEVTGKAAGNVIVEKAVDQVRVGIREGESISVPMEKSGMFPPMVCQMVAVGEETGNLDGMLHKISDFYDMEVDMTLNSLTSMIEPILMIFIGIMVGGIVISMFLPMFALFQNV